MDRSDCLYEIYAAISKLSASINVNNSKYSVRVEEAHGPRVGEHTAYPKLSCCTTRGYSLFHSTLYIQIMSRQDIDPLADTLGPRYAYESDDEDETGLATISSGAAPDVQAIEISFLPPTNDKKPEEGGGVLIVASGAAGAVWARGAALGQQVGQVNVNKRAVSS